MANIGVGDHACIPPSPHNKTTKYAPLFCFSNLCITVVRRSHQHAPEAVGSALSDDAPPTVLVPKLDWLIEASGEASEVSASDTECGIVLVAVWKLPEDSRA